MTIPLPDSTQPLPNGITEIASHKDLPGGWFRMALVKTLEAAQKHPRVKYGYYCAAEQKLFYVQASQPGEPLAQDYEAQR
jgi:hypothetical protein